MATVLMGYAIAGGYGFGPGMATAEAGGYGFGPGMATAEAGGYGFGPGMATAEVWRVWVRTRHGEGYCGCQRKKGQALDEIP